MTDVKTVVDHNCKSPSGATRTEIVFTDDYGDDLRVAFNPLLQKVYFVYKEDSVVLNEDQIQTLMIEAAKFFLMGGHND